MAELFNIWNNFWSNIQEIEKVIEPFAKRCMLTSHEALTLMIVSNYGVSELFNDKDLIGQLCKKGLIEYTENEIKVTSKGAIIAKSLIGALEKQ